MSAPMPGTVIPADIQAVLTPEQVSRLKSLISAPTQPSAHTIAYRVSTWLFGRRIYVTLLSGEEARSFGRVRKEGQQMSGFAFLLRVVLFCGWITICALTLAFAGVVTLYLVKSYAGIDLMDGPSVLHGLFF